MAQVCSAAYIYGTVQGVGFRFHTQRQAQALGLTGYARNLDDGSVEVLACGEQQQVDKLMVWLQQGGPISARVERVLIEARGLTDQANFSIRY